MFWFLLRIWQKILTGPFPCKMGGCGAAEFSFIIAAANGKILGSSPAVWKGRHLGILLCDLITPPDIKGWLAPRAKMAKKMSIFGIFNILPGVHDAHWQNWGQEGAYWVREREESSSQRQRWYRMASANGSYFSFTVKNNPMSNDCLSGPNKTIIWPIWPFEVKGYDFWVMVYSSLILKYIRLSQPAL